MRVACWKGEREGGRELERVSLPGTAVRDARKPATVSIAICQIGPLFRQPPMPVSFTSTFQGCATRRPVLSQQIHVAVTAMFDCWR